MSWFVLFFIIVIVSIVTSEEVGVNVTCVSVNFENGLENFDDSTGQCSAIRSPWEVGHYADINIPPPHESSTTFIKPDGTSCVSSFQFKISATGTLEVTFYMLNGFLSITVNEIRDMGPEVQTNSEVFSSSTPGVVNDSWNTKNITVGSFGTFWGYISIVGSKSPSSELLLDHFRYIPPDFDETHEDCVVYDPEEGSTTTPGEETTTASGDDSTTASGEETTTASGEDTTTASGEETTTASGEETTTVSGEDTTTASGEETTTASGEETTTAPGEETTTASGEDTTTASGEETTTASGEETTTASGEDTTTASGEETTTASGEETTTAPGEETTTASGEDTTTASGEETTTASGEETTTESGEETTTESTEKPEDPEDNDSFWNPFTITMTVALVIIPLVGITICVCEKSKRGAVNKHMFNDYSEPIPVIVPRVKTM